MTLDYSPSFLLLRVLDLRDLLFQPRVFYARHEKRIKGRGGLVPALITAMAFKGASALMNAYWITCLVAAFHGAWLDIMHVGSDVAFERPELFRSWMDGILGFGGTLIGGFWPLAWGLVGGAFRVVLFSLLVHGALVLWPPGGARRAVRYATTLKVICYAQAPVLLAVIPGIGVVLGWALSLSAAAFGLGQIYGGGWRRALPYALFPYVLLSAAFMLAATAVVFLAYRFLSLIH